MRRWLCFLFVLAALAGCGSDIDTVALELGFQPRDLPIGTQRLRYYVLRGVLSDRSDANCEDFMGASAPKRVLSYPSDIVRTGSADVTQTSGANLIIDNIAEGSYMFYLEALNSTGTIVGCGCGKGKIVKGEKTIITIKMVTDCRP